MNKENWLKQGLLTNFDVYNNMLTQLIKDTDDPIEKEKLAQTIREVIFDMNIITYEELDEHYKQYEKYKASDKLKKFFELSRRMVEGVKKEPNRICEFLDILTPYCKMEDETEKVTVDILLGYLLDYLNGVEKENT